ncbi:putative polyadenylate-binding protein [Apostasia shenzhenica]|uniref:Polyadenylate-binding protein n=1 Tax=Apostasia shenzhenica TaxID=1088818 RepID=A0A2I0A6E7_9ASPA|nr:putative polyadenylate-binding protein [Apostasia shenzhenica]
MLAPGGPGPAPAPGAAALYVGDLHEDVVDTSLFQLFSTVGPVASVRICRDTVTGASLGYGYVNYISSQDATNAIEKLNHSILCGKTIRVMWSHRDPDARNSGIGNVFVKNLSGSVDNVKLNEMFSKFGTIASCKVAVQDGKSKGYGFVQFESQDAAGAAIENLNGTTVDGKQIYVGNFIKKTERIIHNPEAKYTNLYMKNLDHDITEELIELKFSEFGKIFNVKIAKDEQGNSKGFGFVNFENPDSAQKAAEAMNGAQLGTKTLYVARAQKKVERQQILRRMFEEKRNEQIRKNTASNVYVKNIDDGVDDNVLREHFGQCGTITSAKVMRDERGISKGFGFVCYSTPEEAGKAVNTLHGCMFHGKPLYVAFAQRKEDRQAQLQHQFAQRMAGAASVVPAGYHQLYYTPPGVMQQIPPRQGLMYQPFGMRPGWRPSGFVPPSRPAFQSMPVPVIPNTPRQRQNRGRMNAHFLPQSGQSLPYMPHLQQASHSINTLMDSNAQQMKYMPNGRQGDMNNVSDMLSSMLAAAPPQQQKQMLGERLFPLVQKLKADLAAKITGMLLEMDNTELLLLLESPESLAAKVEEAVQVLNLSKAKLSGGQETLHNNGFLSAEVAVN